MKIEIDINEYFTPEMIKEIAEDELRKAFRRQFQKESDVERVISNLSYEFVFTLVAEQWDGDFAELKECVEKHIREYPFHELDRNEIGDVIYDVIMDRILSPRREAQP